MRSVLLAATFTVLTAVSSFAQEATTVLVNVPQAQRDAGVYTTPSTVIDEAATQLLVRLQIPTADYEDTQNTVVLRLYVMEPTTGSWRYVGGSRWQGGRYIDDDGIVNPPVTLSIGLGPVRGKEVRAEFEVLRRMRLGGTIETIP